MKQAENIKIIVIDFLCGAGGVTSGFEAAELNKQKIARVIAGLNHDEVAIASHLSNFLHVKHFVKDLRDLDYEKIRKLIAYYKRLYPGAKIIFWFSLECTNFSRAKGGLPRDADSRTLADELLVRKGKLPGYVPAFMPDYVMIENVEEFMSWGPLDKNGKPISRMNGRDYIRWCNKIQSLGYDYDWRLLNSADFGAFTSRKRFFGIFARKGLPIAWPVPTHAKNPEKAGMFEKLEKWKAVRQVLDLNDHGNSIFGRKKNLSEKTLARIYAGLVKYIAGGKDNFLAKIYAVSSSSHGTTATDVPATTITTRDSHALVHPQFLSKYFSGRPEGKNIPVDGPAGAIKTKDSHSLISPEFLLNFHGNSTVNSPDNPSVSLTTKDKSGLVTPQFFMQNNNVGDPSTKVPSIDTACRVLTTTGGNLYLINPQFIAAYYGNGDNVHSTNGPAPTIRTKDGAALINPQFIEIKHSQGKQHQSINDPSGSLTTVTKENLITAERFIMNTNFNNTASSPDHPFPVITANRKWHYLVNPQWGINSGCSVEEPAFTLIARMDKTPPYLVTTENGFLAIEVFETDSEQTKKIKEFMALYGIVDIKMRMLKVSELLKIQGFPDGYILKGTQADQKKFIGNSVVPMVVKCMAEALASKLFQLDEKEAAA